MRREGLNNQPLLWGGVVLLLILQVAWWATVFTQEVNHRAGLRMEVLKHESGGNPPADAVTAIHNDAERRKVMFVSESAFFIFLTCLGIFLLRRALRAEEKGRETQRSFIEIVSHESKTPLTALKLRLEAMKRNPEPAVQRELSLALDEVRRLTSLVDKALNLNRLERAVFQFEPVYVSEIAEQLLRRMEPVLRDKAVQVQVDYDREAQVNGDEAALQNALQSLLENAVIYNDKSPRKLAVTVKGQADKVLITVTDNGPGISEADAQRVFERFARGKGNSAKPGSGLGLYIAKTIFEAHGGTLRLVKRDEPGAQFEILLPRVRPT